MELAAARIWAETPQRFRIIAYGTKAVLMHGFYQEARLSALIGDWKGAAIRFGAFLSLNENMNYRVLAIQEQARALECQIQTELGVKQYDLLIREGKNTPHEALVPAKNITLTTDLPTPRLTH